MMVATAERVPVIRLGPPGAPARTIGWDVLEWTARYLQQPDGPRYRQPWTYTNEQARFVLNWYAVDEEGRWLYRYAMLRRMKGWGKDPVGATLCYVEMIGPCRFGGWRDNGEPFGVPNPAGWVQVAAVSRDQTRNTMTLMPGLVTPQAIEEYQLDIGKEIIYAEGGRRRIEAVTSSPRSLEGGRATFVLKNETHHWIRSNEGHEMSAVIARNVAKSRDGAARVLAISNAHAPGEDSDAERDYEAYRRGAPDMLYDSVEAPDDVTLADPDERLLAVLDAVRGDSYWLSPERLLAEIRDPRTPPAMAYRYYLNKVHALEDRPFDAARFRELRRDRRVPDGALITLGFDGSLTRDHTALWGTEVETGHQFRVGYWEPRVLPNGEHQIDFAEVDQVVEEAFERWRVWRMYVDPYKWGAWIARWSGKYGDDRIVSWSTTRYRKMAQACADYRADIMSGELSHDGDPALEQAVANACKHMLNARDDDGERMWVIQKERPDSPLKIDALMAAILSKQAQRDAVAVGATGRSIYETQRVRYI